MEALLRSVVSTGSSLESDQKVDDRLELLLGDFLACTWAGRDRVHAEAFAADGVAGLAALLALRSSADDLDDVDWRSLHHPGSVVWPVVIALAVHDEVAGDRLARAARAGYLTAAATADLLGATHRAAWHVTATAGALGAASAASVMSGLSQPEHVRALALAAANTGGLAIAARDFSGAACFNRAAAVTLGLVAARAAHGGAVAVAAPFTGPGGLFESMAAAVTPTELTVRDGVLDVAARIYPVSGFLQSMVAAVAALRSQSSGDLRSIRIGLNQGVCSLLDGSVGGAMYDTRLTALRTWTSGSAFRAVTPCELDAATHLVEVYGSNLLPGYADVVITTDSESVSVVAGAPPSLASAGAPELLREKWSRVLALDVDAIQDIAHRSLTELDFGPHLRRTWML